MQFAKQGIKDELLYLMQNLKEHLITNYKTKFDFVQQKLFWIKVS